MNETTQRARPFDLFLILCVAVAARALLIYLIPDRAFSTDLHDWRIVAANFLIGRDPYLYCPAVLNWPPFWPEVLFVLSRICQRWDVDFFLTVRRLLTAVDLLLICATWRIMTRLKTPRRSAVLLFGFALNPLLILLTVQHGNFDAAAVLCIMLALGSLLSYRKTGREIDWLLAAAWLGIGGFVKTFPILLAPLLIPGARKFGWKQTLLAIALLLGPAILSLVPLYILHPEIIRTNVLAYRGIDGQFGITSLAYVPHLADAFHLYAHAFPWLLLTALTSLAIALWFRDLSSDTHLVLLAALMLLAIFFFGTGFGQQYWFWIAPPLLAVGPLCSRFMRRTLLFAALAIIALSLFEYAVELPLGQWLFIGKPNPLGDRLLNSPAWLALVHLPYTLSAAAILITGTRELFLKAQPKADSNSTNTTSP